MPDFTSALYLGFHHPSASLRPWSGISPGHPAAFREPASTDKIAAKLADLQGCERGVLGSSTLHLFWDLFGQFAKKPVHIFFDVELYAIGRWGVERATGLGIPAHPFRHLNAENLREKLNERLEPGLEPVIVTDGFCPDCGRAAPLRRYTEILEEYGGRIVIDDTQALGILGHLPDSSAPYGQGGGGILRWCGIESSDVVVISSMAKAFGVPIAILSGSGSAIRDFKERSQTRVHCSPPSIANICAAEHALMVNGKRGDGLRAKLAYMVGRFRKGAANAGFSLTQGIFPVQSLDPGDAESAMDLHKRLTRRRIQTVLRKNATGKLQISFLINARHTVEDIDIAIESLQAIGQMSTSGVK